MSRFKRGRKVLGQVKEVGKSFIEESKRDYGDIKVQYGKAKENVRRIQQAYRKSRQSGAVAWLIRRAEAAERNLGKMPQPRSMFEQPRKRRRKKRR